MAGIYGNNPSSKMSREASKLQYLSFLADIPILPHRKDSNYLLQSIFISISTFSHFIEFFRYMSIEPSNIILPHGSFFLKLSEGLI